MFLGIEKREKKKTEEKGRRARLKGQRKSRAEEENSEKWREGEREEKDGRENACTSTERER